MPDPKEAGPADGFSCPSFLYSTGFYLVQRSANGEELAFPFYRRISVYPFPKSSKMEVFLEASESMPPKTTVRVMALVTKVLPNAILPDLSGQNRPLFPTSYRYATNYSRSWDGQKRSAVLALPIPSLDETHPSPTCLPRLQLRLEPDRQGDPQVG